MPDTEHANPTAQAPNEGDKSSATPLAAPEPSPGASAAGDTGNADAQQPLKPKDYRELASRRKTFSEKARQLKAREQDLANKEKASVERIASIEKQLADANAKLNKWEKENPLVVAAEMGADPAAHVRDYVEKTTPERQLEAMRLKIAELESKLSDVPKTIEQKEAEWRKRAEDNRAAQIATIESRERDSFTKTLRSSGAQYRHVNAECDDDALEAALSEIQAWIRTPEARKARTVNGEFKPLTFEEVASYLDKRYQPVYESREARRRSLLEAPASPGSVNRDKKSPPATRREESKPRTTVPDTRALSVAERRRFERQNRERQEREDVDRLRRATEQDRIHRAKENGIKTPTRT